MAGFMLNGCAVSLLMVPYCSLEELARGKMQTMDDECQSKEPIKLSFSEEEPQSKELIKSPLSEFKGRSDMGSVLTISSQNIASLDLPVIDYEESQGNFLTKLKKMFNLSLLKNPATSVSLVHWLFIYLSSSVASTFLPTVTAQYGIPGTTSSLMLSAMGLGCFLGRILSGFLGSVPRVHATYVVMVLSAVFSLCYIVLTWIRSVPGFFTLASLTGFLEGKYNVEIQ